MKRNFLGIGLDAVAEDSWQGWKGELQYAVNDAIAMGGMFSQGGFTSRTLLNSRATLENIIGELEMAADLSDEGDALVYFAAGHGGDDESFEDRQFFCAHNGAFTDKKLHQMLVRFKKDVDVVFIGDFCNVGGFNRSLGLGFFTRVNRYMPQGTKPTRRTRVEKTEEIKATVLQLLACRTLEEAAEGKEAGKPGHGYFTQELLDSIAEGITWEQWFTATSTAVTARNVMQHPVAHELGEHTIFPAKVFSFEVSPQ